ncbi:flagellar basal body P-ring formation chaperone FlgA [uncultured Alsobacter sp.]|uniref:flagellar basal body P-ring formation chaperone FlgA n=1 Tax=uncultured Alsobacter sp. TaxID=1748258 RepID=UPI0025FCE6D9|nr:flagellar basal body P-ring formation chaperone FlgA [uncultured Alsobacter sp.]
MHLLLRTGFALTVIISSVLPLAAQQPPARVALRADVAVNRETVTLGDLLEVSGAIADTPVFRAPALGRSGTIQVSRVVEAARAMGLEPINRAAAAQVTVTRQARRISKTEVEEMVRRGLGSRFGMDQAEVSITLDNGENAIFVEPEATGDLKIVDIFHDPKARRVEAVLTIPASRSLTARPLRVSGSVVDMVEVPVLVRAVARGEAIRAVDLRTERRARAELPAGALTDAGSLTGKVTRNALVAGSLLREGDLVKQDIVEKNSMVTVVYEGPGLSLSMRGKAMEAGAMGDAILIQNVQSKRAVQGTVIGPGKVSVNFGVPGPVAAVQSTLE